MEPSALEMAAARLRNNLYRGKLKRTLTPAEIQLILALLPMVLSAVQGCIYRTDDPEELERRAYRFITSRRLLDVLLRRKIKTMRETAARCWIEVGGDPEMAPTMGEAIEEESRSIDRDFFHKLWKQAQDHGSFKRE